MQQNATKFKWTSQRDRAAQLVAADELSDASIADEIGINRATLHRWKKNSDFATRVEAIRAEWRDKLAAEGLLNKQNRLNALNDRWQRMNKVIEGRSLNLSGVDLEGVPEVPGGETGLLVHQRKAIGVGQNQQIIDTYEVDTGLLKELRAHEEQAAKELGEWSEKADVKVTAAEEFLSALRVFSHDDGA